MTLPQRRPRNEADRLDHHAFVAACACKGQRPCGVVGDHRGDARTSRPLERRDRSTAVLDEVRPIEVETVKNRPATPRPKGVFDARPRRPSSATAGGSPAATEPAHRSAGTAQAARGARRSPRHRGSEVAGVGRAVSATAEPSVMSLRLRVVHLGRLGDPRAPSGFHSDRRQSPRRWLTHRRRRRSTPASAAPAGAPGSGSRRAGLALQGDIAPCGGRPWRPAVPPAGQAPSDRIGHPGRRALPGSPADQLSLGQPASRAVNRNAAHPRIPGRWRWGRRRSSKTLRSEFGRGGLDVIIGPSPTPPALAELRPPTEAPAGPRRARRSGEQVGEQRRSTAACRAVTSASSVTA
jgi:hypothetical protein